MLFRDFSRVVFSFLLAGIMVKADLGEIPQNHRTVLEAESNFCKASIEHGTREAFLQFLAEDGLLFRPIPILGLGKIKTEANRPGVLTWQPVYVDVSAANDLAFTFGPWQFRRQTTNDPVLQSGYFITVWKRNDAGQWKVAADTGVYSEIDQDVQPISLRWSGLNTKAIELSNHSVADFLKAAEQGLQNLAKDLGFYRALDSASKGDPWIFRDGSGLIEGVGENTKVHSVKTEEWFFSTSKVTSSSSGDIGFTCGTLTKSGDIRNPAEETAKGGWLRVWKADSWGRWRVVLDVVNLP